LAKGLRVASGLGENGFLNGVRSPASGFFQAGLGGKLRPAPGLSPKGLLPPGFAP
jgi:hypothetical protein